jgi:hypothetical protein
MLIDLHLVAPAGAEGTLVDRLLEACVEAGLDGACLVGAGGPPPVDAARASRFASRLALFFGVEIPLERGRLVWIPEDPTLLGTGDWRATVGDKPTLASVLALREACGGAVVAAHPYDRAGGVPFADGIYQAKGLDGVMAGSAALDRARNNMAVEAAQRLEVQPVGGTGGGVGPEGVGASATAFASEFTDQASLVAALKRKDAWAVDLVSRPEQLAEEEASDRGHGEDRRGPPRDRGGWRGGDRGPGDRRDGRGGGRDGHDGRRDGGRGDRPGGFRGDRPQGDRAPRPPQDRPQGERPAGDRPQGDRPPRPQGDRPQGEPGAGAAGEGEHRRRRRRRGGGGGRGPGEGGPGSGPTTPVPQEGNA